MKTEKLEKIAIFPIPELVTFPNSTVPLHVFEPRYRSMIKDCVKQNIKIGVAHIDKVIKTAPKNEDISKVLSSNRDNFVPKKVFSAGYCEIKEVTEDGRLLVDIKMQSRYQLKEVNQDVPYKVCLCEAYFDENDEESEVKEHEESFSQMRALIDGFLIKFAETKDDGVFLEFLGSQKWTDLSMKDYSFKIFETIKFEGDLAQKALEMKSVGERLRFVCECLNLIN